MYPRAGDTVQRSRRSLLPATCAATRIDCPSSISFRFMLNLIANAFSVTVALAEAFGSTTLVAVTVTLESASIADGAVYIPSAEIMPTAGTSDHSTRVSGAPVTSGTNVAVSTAARVALVWLRWIVATTGTGLTVITVVEDLVRTRSLIAVTVTFCSCGTNGGAVYTPSPEITPRGALSVQPTAPGWPR